MQVKKAVFSILAFAAAGASLTPAQALEQAKADLVNRQQLRVCSDPSDLPFSNEKGEGFENKIAELIGEELKLPVVYTWFPKSMGFIRSTLALKKCDLVIGWGQGDELVLNTNAIYRSVSALIYKKGGPLEGVEQLSDPRLQDKKIGVVQRDAGGTLAARYGLMRNSKGFVQEVDRRYFNPAAEMMKDIRSGEIDAGIHWGPIAAYWGARDGEALKVVPLVKEPTPNKLISFRITMGVRQGDDAWKRQLNQIIAKRQGDIDKILLDYGLPLLVDDDTKMDLLTAPRPNGTAVVEDKTEPPKKSESSDGEAGAPRVEAPAAGGATPPAAGAQ